MRDLRNVERDLRRRLGRIERHEISTASPVVSIGYRAFTIIELLVVVAIIALLIGILLPAIGKARDQARLTMSLTNLRNLATAHATYASEWNDRQFTIINDNIASLGSSAVPAFTQYAANNGSLGPASLHPPIILGWTAASSAGPGQYYTYDHTPGLWEVHGLAQPIVFNDQVDGFEYFGAFRIPNVSQFNQYVGGKFYDPVFYAPKDTVVMNSIETRGPNDTSCFDDPGEFCVGEQLPAWSSYCLSPAGMFNPLVLANPDRGGFSNPWTIPAGFRSPSMGMALYPSLKTHMLEHHWLQASRAECNSAMWVTFYEGCEPFYFNMAWESNPATLFYDGHVETVGVRKAERADGRQQVQAGYGLWSRDTSWGNEGYVSDYGYDYAQTSFHILTTDGIRGRDLTSD